MDDTEQRAQEFLAAKYGKSLIHEPNGASTFPDFISGNGTLYEVTRINPLVEEGGWLRAIEDTFARALSEVPVPSLLESDVYISLELDFDRLHAEYSKLLEGDKEHRREVQSKLRRAVRSELAREENWETLLGGERFELSRWAEVGLFVSRPSEDPIIRFGGSVGPSGWVVSELIGQVSRAVDTKNAKLMNYQGTPYQEAWLMVAGSAVFGFPSVDLAAVVRGIGGVTYWRGCVLVDITNPEQSVEVEFEK